MKVVIRVDSSAQIGSGHLVRCLTLANALRRRGVQVQFICRNHIGHLSDVLTQAGFSVVLLPQPLNAQDSTVFVEDYEAWLGVTQEQDAQETIDLIKEISPSPDWLIIDHYALDQAWEKLLRPHVKKIFVIDDLANRAHDCDSLLDQNENLAPKLRYQDLVPKHCHLLTGCQYALLKPEYVAYRQTLKPRVGKLRRILIFFGGTDPDNMTGMAIQTLSCPELQHITLDVVIGKNNPHYANLQKVSSQRGNINFHHSLPHLAELMATADLAIGAGGTTTWERFCLSLPSVIISIAKNQESVCQTLAEKDLIYYLGNSKNVSNHQLKTIIIKLLENPQSLQKNSSKIAKKVDGFGIQRIIYSLLSSTLESLWLSPCNNNPLNNMTPKLGTEQTKFLQFTLKHEDLALGEMYFELSQDLAFINYDLDPLISRSKKIANHFFKLGIRAFFATQPKQLTHGRIKPLHNYPWIQQKPETKEGTDEKKELAIAIVSDENSWINDFIPELITELLKKGYKIQWLHNHQGTSNGDICFYLSFGKIVGPQTLKKFTHNLVVHESDLPKGKGWSPLTWQILKGENEIPIVLFEAAKKVDNGNIYLKEKIYFKGTELISELRQSQAQKTVKLCLDFIKTYPDIIKTAKGQKGPESFYSKRTPQDSQLNINKSIREQFNLLRVVDNFRYPAFFEIDGVAYEIIIKKKGKCDDQA